MERHTSFSIFYIFFDAKDDLPIKAKVLDESRMKQIFEPLEDIETNGSIFACSKAVIFTDAQGFHDIVSHLDS